MNQNDVVDLVALAGQLRAKGVAVGVGQVVTAAAALEQVSSAEPELVRTTLRLTLVCAPAARHVLDDLLDVVYPGEVPQQGVVVPFAADIDARGLRQRLHAVLLNLDHAGVRPLAEAALTSWGATGTPGQAPSGWSKRNTLRGLRLEEAVTHALRDREALVAAKHPYERHIVEADVRRLARDIDREVGSAVVRFSRADKTIDRVATYLVRGSLGDVDFLTSAPDELARLTGSIRPVAHEMRVALTKQRRQRGAVDMRRTLRRAMGTGGLPVDLVRARRRRRRPDLVLVCDMSGSVAGFSTFTLALMGALSTEFTRVRLFGFVNRVAEVPPLTPREWEEKLASGWREDVLCGTHTSSDYGAVLDQFAQNHLPAVGRHTHVLILGDARSNFSDPRAGTLARIAYQAGAVDWLNPEARTSWDTGDSAAKSYRAVAPMHEVRTLTDLRHFVSWTFGK